MVLVRQRLLLAAFIMLVVFPAWSATYYVDLACPTAGNGTSATCLSSPATNNPKKLLDDGIALLPGTNDGSVLNVRGIHSAHDNCPGSTTGRYSADRFMIQNKTGASGATVQNNGYTGQGTGETAFIDGGVQPSGGWTQCSGTAGSCNSPCDSTTLGTNLPGGVACTNFWYATDTSSAPYVIGAIKSDNTPTYRVLTASALTNSNSANTKVCSTTTWMFCDTNSNCPSGETCTGTSAELDSFSTCTIHSDSPGCATGGVEKIVVQAGGSNPGLDVFANNNGYGFEVRNSAFITIRGFIFRNHERSAIVASHIDFPTITDITFKDNIDYYNMDRYHSGSGYGTWIQGVTPATLQGNTIAYSDSEALHIGAKLSEVATVLTIKDNWIHHVGDQTVMGPGSSGTSQGGILGNSGSGASEGGNFTGSVLSGNLFTNIKNEAGTSGGKGLILENDSSNWTIRDNIFQDIDGECLKLDGKEVAVSNNLIFNNIFRKCGQNPGGGTNAGLLFGTSLSGTHVDSNSLYNNTFIECAGACIQTDCSGTCASNLLRNNIFWTAGSGKQINWAKVDVTNIFENNLVVTTASPAATWNGAHVSGGPDYTCAQLTNIAASDIASCPSPAFANSASDFHLLTSSPAKDTGTATGMPASRTTDINNTLASLHGLVSYADNQAQAGSAWDIGADEFAGTPTLTISKADSPDPVTVGSNITYTLSYNNTGSGSASNVSISDTVPTNTTFVSATNGGTLNAGVVTWTIGTVLASSSGFVQMVVQAGPSLGHGRVISNDTYSITSTETGAVAGSADTTTISNPSSKRGHVISGRR